MTKKLTFAAIALLAAGIGGGYALSSTSSGKPYNSILQDDPKPLVQTSYSGGAAAQPVDFERAAGTAVPSVVHIRTVVKFKQTQSRGGMNPFGMDDQLFERFFGGGRSFQRPDQKASGSGVIISEDGYIVTNNHVVDGANEITVTLNDRKDYKAKVVGNDPNTDLALIKIDGKGLPVMPLGNSDEVRLGQWVLAVGYPLNLDVTVTQGIISAKSRNIGINRQGSAPVEAFLQTDAAVNPGSSGGALVNTNGELIGINAAIASPTGSYAGYAYSIPSNLMKKVVGDIMKYGSVQRGYLGISMAPENLDEATRRELGVTDDGNGVWVADTDPNGAAAAAGIRKGDAITKVNDVAVTSSSKLSELIAMQKPGDKVDLVVLRDGKERKVSVTLKGKLGAMSGQQAAAVEALGADFEPLSKSDAAKLRLPGGLQVTNIRDGVISGQTNMRPGFIITKIGGITVRNIEELKSALAKQDGNFQIEGTYPGSGNTYYYGINDLN
ncbi:trypsin-like peptidase domain-containing protein [Chitinophaga sp. XS-30]|uniref:trypsin-like peptidase domain-containing protein n=1 Tax=Chitinophaga sp. XS-30 TaxID=2604421 RepID=UPI00143CEEF0|nr:trypsin-like peptidase domain-containing protein [Chitinophaga sp. XS-30]